MTALERLMNWTSRIIDFITGKLPLKNQIIFESKPFFSDNTFCVYKKMVDCGYNKKYRMYWLSDGSDSNIKLPKNVFIIKRDADSPIEKIKTYWIISRAKFIIDCNVYVYKKTSRQIRIHLKHGLPLKNAEDYNFRIGELDLLSVPSDYWIKPCSAEHNIDSGYIKALGFPRNDCLVPKPHEQKNIIWMPTWISTASEFQTDENCRNLVKKIPYGLPCIDDISQLHEINNLFREHDAILYIRLHPAQDDDLLPIKNMSNIVLCDNKFLEENNITLYSFLCTTDALVSDYSSVYYDYLKLDKPIALIIKFYEEYNSYRKAMPYSYEEYKTRFPASFIVSYEELKTFFENVFNEKDPDCEKRKAAKEKYMPDSDSDSSENIINYMKENYGF